MTTQTLPSYDTLLAFCRHVRRLWPSRDIGWPYHSAPDEMWEQVVRSFRDGLAPLAWMEPHGGEKTLLRYCLKQHMAHNLDYLPSVVDLNAIAHAALRKQREEAEQRARQAEREQLDPSDTEVELRCIALIRFRLGQTDSDHNPYAATDDKKKQDLLAWAERQGLPTTPIKGNNTLFKGVL